MPGSKLFVLNFGHRLARDVVEQLRPCEEIYCPLNLDMDQETMSQVVNRVRIAVSEVKKRGGALDGSVPVAVVLPGITEGAALVLAEIHGRVGAFPKILRLRRRADATYGLFENGPSGGIFDLEKFRQSARGRR